MTHPLTHLHSWSSCVDLVSGWPEKRREDPSFCGERWVRMSPAVRPLATPIRTIQPGSMSTAWDHQHWGATGAPIRTHFHEWVTGDTRGPGTLHRRWGKRWDRFVLEPVRERGARVIHGTSCPTRARSAAIRTVLSWPVAAHVPHRRAAGPAHTRLCRWGRLRELHTGVSRRAKASVI